MVVGFPLYGGRLVKHSYPVNTGSAVYIARGYGILALSAFAFGCIRHQCNEIYPAGPRFGSDSFAHKPVPASRWQKSFLLQRCHSSCLFYSSNNPSPISLENFDIHC